jgi:hypothetical protein
MCTTCFNIPKLSILPPHSIYVFRMVLTINSDCFAEQHQPVGLCKADKVFFCEVLTYYF